MAQSTFQRYGDQYASASEMGGIDEQEELMREQIALAQRLRGAPASQQRDLSFWGNVGRAGHGIPAAYSEYLANQARVKAAALRKGVLEKAKARQDVKEAAKREEEEFKKERYQNENMQLAREAQEYAGAPTGFGTGITSNVNTGSQPPWYDPDDEDMSGGQYSFTGGGGGDDY